MLATIVCSGAKRKIVIEIEEVREYQPVNSRSIDAITNSPFVRYNKGSTIVRSLRRAADCSIPTRSVSEGQFRRSLTYVSGYDW